MAVESRDELHWLAFRYVSGEMSDGERVQFERRLADDETACDAVEQAVEMSEAIRLGASEPLSTPRSRVTVFLRHPATWVACLLLAITLAWLNSIGLQRPGDGAAERIVEQAGVSLAWAALRDRQIAEEIGDATPRWADPADTVDLGMESSVGDLDATDARVPQWLLTAVSVGEAPSKEIQ